MPTISKPLYLDAPNVGRDEKRNISQAIGTGYVSTIGPFVQEFEKRFAGYLNVRKAVSTQSGTAALHMALHSLGLGKGDEVIIPALTFAATANPVIYVGARPVFADVDPETWVIGPEDFEKNITSRTRAIIPVHLYGNPCNMSDIIRIAKKHNIFVIEDATESLGAKFNLRHTGTFGDFGCFSFNGNKIITTGGGGMIVGHDKNRMERLKILANQARDNADGYHHSEVGFNYRMTNIEAAMGISQFNKLNSLLKIKRMINNVYKRSLGALDTVRFQKEYDNAAGSYWFSAITLRSRIDPESLRKKLSRQSIPTRRVFMPLPMMPPYKKYGKGRYPNSYSVYESGLCLPSSTLNSKNDIERVCSVVKKIL
jgi:perosamine synthetase